MGSQLLDTQERKMLAENSSTRGRWLDANRLPMADSGENLSIRSLSELIAPEAVKDRRERLFGNALESKPIAEVNISPTATRTMMSASVFVMHPHDCPSLDLVVTFLHQSGFVIDGIDREKGTIEATGDAGVTNALAHSKLFGYVRPYMTYCADYEGKSGA